jgi:hypothetical protein
VCADLATLGDFARVVIVWLTRLGHQLVVLSGDNAPDYEGKEECPVYTPMIAQHQVYLGGGRFPFLPDAPEAGKFMACRILTATWLALWC